MGILRSITAKDEPFNQDCVARWFATVENRAFISPSGVDEASMYFHVRYPEQADRYGPAFLEKTEKEPGMPSLSRATFLNTDFFGAILSGDYGLGHRVVYLPQETTFYYFDVRADAYCPVSDAKIQLLASNILVKAAEACSQKVNTRPLLEDFRKPPVLREVCFKAKAILEADRMFFTGTHGKVRLIDGQRVDPTSELPHRLFVREGMARLQGSKITVAEAYSHYARFCRINHLPALRMVDFKNEVSATIHEVYNLRPRHDIPGEDQKATHGWRDLACTFQ